MVYKLIICSKHVLKFSLTTDGIKFLVWIEYYLCILLARVTYPHLTLWKSSKYTLVMAHSFEHDLNISIWKQLTTILSILAWGHLVCDCHFCEKIRSIHEVNWTASLR